MFLRQCVTKGVGFVSIQEWETQVSTILESFFKQVELKPGQLLVIGCSTSEVVGQKIGTAGTMEIAEMIFQQLMNFQRQLGIRYAFQCCEHLNRALVVDRETAISRNYEEVSVIPIRNAGGAMATYAFEHLPDAVVVEEVSADAGIDIGNTLIGMHLKRVAVPIRTEHKKVGEAHVTLAKTRPKLIGGVRAVYERSSDSEFCH
jgi:uncharacterized protein (TIGR01440 family)